MKGNFNRNALLPYELRLKDFELAMQDVYDLFYDINESLIEKGLQRIEDMLERRGYASSYIESTALPSRRATGDRWNLSAST